MSIFRSIDGWMNSRKANSISMYNSDADMMLHLLAHLYNIAKPTNTYDYNLDITNSETIILGDQGRVGANKHSGKVATSFPSLFHLFFYSIS